MSSETQISQDNFPINVLPGEIIVEKLENLTKSQVKEWMEVFIKNGILSNVLGNLRVLMLEFEKENLALKLWTFSNGNPLKLFNSSLRM